jgi:hypothetical protein
MSSRNFAARLDRLARGIPEPPDDRPPMTPEVAHAVMSAAAYADPTPGWFSDDPSEVDPARVEAAGRMAERLEKAESEGRLEEELTAVRSEFGERYEFP